jgi:hypothetical protein
VDRTYFNCDETEEKVVLSFGPMLYTLAIIATEMPPAIMAYSMAVAPDSSAKKQRNFASMRSVSRGQIKLP